MFKLILKDDDIYTFLNSFILYNYIYKMERDVNFKFEDIYNNMDEKNEKPTKKLLIEYSSSTTNTIFPFCCSNFFNCLFDC